MKTHRVRLFALTDQLKFMSGIVFLYSMCGSLTWKVSMDGRREQHSTGLY